MGLFDKAFKKLVGKKPKKQDKGKIKKEKSIPKKKKPIKKVKKLKPTKKRAMKKVYPKKKVVKVIKKKKKNILKVKKAKPKQPKQKIKKKILKKLKKTVKVKKKKKKEKKKIPKKPLTIPLEIKISKARTLKLIKEKEALEFIIEKAGEEGYKVYDYLVNIGKEVDEYTLADKVDLQINFVRSLLYKLYEHKLVSFFRERDKKKGWFIYYWIAHPEKLKYILITKKREKIEKLDHQLKISEDSFFCENCNKTVDYSNAMETMFFCDRCGSHLTAMNSMDVKTKINKEIEKLKKQIAEIEKI